MLRCERSIVIAQRSFADAFPLVGKHFCRYRIARWQTYFRFALQLRLGAEKLLRALIARRRNEPLLQLARLNILMKFRKEEKSLV